MSEKINIKAYFERIGFAGSIAPTLATLAQLHALHPASIPFENLDPIIGLPVQLDQPSLEQKLLHNRRGGFCFEQNTLFMRILADLDFGVKAYAARVLWGHPEGTERVLSHMVLGIDVAGAPYLADVGFGGFTLTAPLKMRPDIAQTTPNETFRLISAGDGFRLEVELDKIWTPVYQFDLVEQNAEQLAALSVTIADDHHDRKLFMASRVEKAVRYNLNRNRLTIHRAGEPREREILPDLEALKMTLATTFDINLPAADLLDPALLRVLEIATAETA